MGILDRLLGRGERADAGPDGPTGQLEDVLPVGGAVADGDPTLHRVVAWVPLSDAALELAREQQRVYGLEDRLMRALYASGAGDFDTNELDRGYLAIRFQGRDADAMVAVLQPLLADAPRGTYLAVRRGPYGAPEDRIDVTEPAAPG